MQGFIYTIIISTIISWIYVYKTLNTLAPDNTGNIIYVLLLMLTSLSLTSSIILYFYNIKKTHEIINKRRLYRQAFKTGFKYSLLITGYFALRSFQIANALNTILYVVLCAMIILNIGKRNEKN